MPNGFYNDMLPAHSSACHVVQTPTFIPVGTQGVIKGIACDQVEELGCQIILGNTYHLPLRPGADPFEQTGGPNWARGLLSLDRLWWLSDAEIAEEGVTYQIGSNEWRSPRRKW